MMRVDLVIDKKKKSLTYYKPTPITKIAIANPNHLNLLGFYYCEVKSF